MLFIRITRLRASRRRDFSVCMSRRQKAWTGARRMWRVCRIIALGAFA